MTSKPLCRLLLFFDLFVALACEADAQAQLGGVPGTGGPAEHAAELPVVDVRGETPYVEVGGKEVAVSPGKIKFYPANGPFLLYGKTPPSWVFASNLTTRRVLLNDKRDAARISSFNKEFQFSVDLESPTPLDKVWIVVRLGDENGNLETLLQEVGTLRPYKITTVTIRKRLHQDLYDEPHVDWNLFVHGCEVFNSMMNSDAIAEGMSGIVSRLRQGVMDAETEPYLTFPPRDSPKAKNPVKLEVEIDRRGFIKTASVVNGSDQPIEKSLLGAVAQWWFLPRRIGGRSVECRASIAVDLSKWKTWSNDCVVLQSASRSSASATREREIASSINPQEQSGPTGTAPRTGIALPVAIFQVLPVIPERFSGQGIEGKVTVEFHVQPDGTVQAAKVVAQTFEMFGSAAVECVKQWKFRPALRDGVPVGIRMTVPIVFMPAGCLPASPFDGYYDQAYLNKQLVTKARAQELVALVAGLKYPANRSEFYASLGNPGGQIGVLRRLAFDGGTHVASYQLNALGSDEKYYALNVYYSADEQGSFENPRVNRAEVVLSSPLPIPNFEVEETAGNSQPP